MLEKAKDSEQEYQQQVMKSLQYFGKI